MTNIEGTTYDVFAMNGADWIIEDKMNLPDIDWAKAYAEKFMKEHDPYKILITKHETFCYFTAERDTNENE